MAAIIGLKGAFRTLLSYDGSTPGEGDELGVIRHEIDGLTSGMKSYRFVQVADTSAAVANGTVVTFSDVYGREVTTDISETGQNFVAGVGIGVITPGNSGWIQVYGHHAAVKTNGDDDVAAGDMLIVDSTTDGTANSVTAGTAPTHKTIGVAVAADVDADDTVAAFISCL